MTLTAYYFSTTDYENPTSVGNTQGVTDSVLEGATTDTGTITFNIPCTYDGKKINNLTFISSAKIDFGTTADWWTEQSDGSYQLTASFSINSVTTASGSLEVSFINENGIKLETFKAIPGELDTTILEKGDYADISVPIIFNKLKNTLYTDNVFDSILYNLTAFFVSIALQQRISERIDKLVKLFVLGEITLEEFNISVNQGNEEFAGQYGDNYVNNYLKVQSAIEKFKYILQN
jgi:hypothetical protein